MISFNRNVGYTFNRNTIKKSYKCMPNITTEINKQISNLFGPQPNNEKINQSYEVFA